MEDSSLVNAKKPATQSRLTINRPTAEQGDQSFKATLRLFPKGTSVDTINDKELAKNAALASQEYTIVIKAAEPAKPDYTMTVKVVDENEQPVSNAIVTLTKGYSSNKVTAETDGSYKMEENGTYSLTVQKDGYKEYKKSYFTFTPADPYVANTEITVKLEKIAYRNVKFNVIDKASGKVIENATIRVKKSVYDTGGVTAEEDGSYNLISGNTYYYVVSAHNYNDAYNVAINPTEDTTITVSLIKNITEYSVFIKPADSSGNAVSNPNIQVTYEEYDDYYEEYL